MTHNSKDELIRKAVEETERRLEVDYRISKLEEEVKELQGKWEIFKAERLKVLLALIALIGVLATAIATVLANLIK